jgi:hypothetical protein
MYNSKFIQIWTSFDRPMQNRFRKFVHSPYHNKHADVLQLLEYVEKEEHCRYESAFEYIYGNQDYKDSKIRNILSYLQKLMDKFLIYEELENDQLKSNQLLLQAYRNLKIEKAFNGALRFAEQQQEKQDYRNAQYYLGAYQLQTEAYIFHEQENRTEEKNMQALHDSFETYYLANKLRLALAVLTHQAHVKTEYRLDQMEACLAQAEEPPYKDIPAIQLYYHGYLALSQPKEERHFFQLKKGLETQKNLFPKAELKGLFTIAINFCIRRLNGGEVSYTAELFDLYKWGLKEEILVEQQSISRFSFKNIVTVGLKMRAFDWVHDFISNYAALLPKEYQQVQLDYNMAKYYYMTQQYKKAMRLLLQLQTDDLSINLGSRVSLLKIYYELKEWEPLESLLDSFGAYVRRNKAMSAYHKKSYKSLIRFTQKLLSYNFYDAKARAVLKSELEAAEQLPERDWLLQQLDKK